MDSPRNAFASCVRLSSRGAEARRAVAAEVRAACLGSQLTLCVNVNVDVEWLTAHGVATKQLPVVLDASTPAKKRRATFRTARCVVITPRVLIADLLAGVVNATDIARIVVARGERLGRDAAALFCVRVYRERNADACVRGYSTEPAADFEAYAKVVVDDRQQEEAAYSSVEVLASSEMAAIDSEIAEALRVSVASLRRAVEAEARSSSRSAEDTLLLLSEDENLSAYYETELGRLTASMRKPATTRALRELSRLRRLRVALWREGAVAFHARLFDLQQRNARRIQWFATDGYDTTIAAAKTRLLREDDDKWDSLATLLTGGLSVVLVADGTQAALLQRYLIARNVQTWWHAGGSIDEELDEEDVTSAVKSAVTFGADIARLRKCLLEEDEVVVLGSAEDVELATALELSATDEDASFLADMERAMALSRGVVPASSPEKQRRVVAILTGGQWRSRVDILSELEPSLVVLCDSMLPDFLRDARAHAQATDCRVAVVEYPIERLARQATQRHEDKILARVVESSRRVVAPMLIEEKEKLGVVIVDARELRSQLPLALHERGYEVQIETLRVGDYVLSPGCAVERKAVETGDLANSLESGRLWKQLDHLRKTYDRAILLIEFEGGLRSVYDQDHGDLSMRTIQHKLTKVMMDYPDVRFLWSNSAKQTVDLFTAVKSSEAAEPEAGVARSLGAPDDDAFATDLPRILLSKLPGVTREKEERLLEEASTIAEVAKLVGDESLAQIIGERPATALSEYFLHREPQPPPPPPGFAAEQQQQQQQQQQQLLLLPNSITSSGAALRNRSNHTIIPLHQGGGGKHNKNRESTKS